MLFEYQDKIKQEDKKKCGIFLSTGCGKTRVALELAQGRILIIMPKTQKLDMNWERELIKMNVQKDITTISKETFRRDWKTIGHYDTLIIDEADTCLGVTPTICYVKKQAIPKTSQIFEAIKQWVLIHSPERIYLCTATISRTPMTIWGAGHILGASWDWRDFRNEFYTSFTHGRVEIYQKRKDEQSKIKLAKLVNTLGYTGQLSDFHDVPEQTYRTDYLYRTDEQKKQSDALSILHPSPLVLRGKRFQVDNGLLIGNQFEPTVYFDNPKMDKILDYSLEFKKIVIFIRFTSLILKTQQILEKEGYTVFVLNGQTKDRAEVIAKAESLDNCILLCQSSISAGYQLPSFPVMIFQTLSNKWVDRTQAEGRILRSDALKKNLYITLVVKNGADEECYKNIISGEDFNDATYEKD